MSKLIAGIKNFFRREEGPTMVEYALLIALIAIVVAVGAAVLGEDLKELFEDVAELI